MTGRPTPEAWLNARLPAIDSASMPFQLAPASADASFRRYFRVTGANGSTRILMDAPPQHEPCAPFVTVTGLLRDAGLNAPAILAADVDAGYLLLSDLGRQTYLQAIQAGELSERDIDQHFRQAIEALVTWQLASRDGVLPRYDEALLRRELELFPEWFLRRHLGLELSTADDKTLATLFQRLIDQALAQAPVYVHRDFMPRNLMLPGDDGRPGILDYQDAVFGPISYDIVSLTRDAFISWEETQVIDWTVRYWEQARAAGLPVPADFGDFWRDVEWMGLQRHLKVLGIFCRLNYRDGKADYLADLPRFIGYARAVAGRYRALAPLLPILDRAEQKAPAPVGYTF